MKTSKQLREERGLINEELTTLEKTFEGVEPTEEQRSAYQAKLDEVEKLTNDIAFAERAEKAKAERAASATFGAGVQIESKEESKAKEGFDLMRAISLVKSKRALDGLEGEMRQEAEKELRGFNQGVSDIAIPSWMLEKRTDIDQATSLIQPTVTGAYVDALRENGLWEKVGVNVLSGLTSDYKIPIVGKQSVAWASAENSAAADGGANFTSATLNPTRTTAYVDISNKILLQNGQAAQNAVMRDLGRATAQLWNTAMFSTASVSNAPASLAATSGVGTFTEASYSANTSVASDINVAEQTLLDAQGAGGRVNVVLATNLLAELRRSAEVASVSPIMTTDGLDKYLLGYASHFTVAATKSAGVSGDFLMGDFSYVYMGLFGGMNIQVDPYTVNINDQVRLVLHRYVDWALTQGGALVKATSLVA